MHSHWSSPTLWPARALPCSSILDTYSISEEWLSRFVSIKMQKQMHETLTELQPKRNKARDNQSLLQEAGSWEKLKKKKNSGWSICTVMPSKISSLHTVSEVYPAPAAACWHCWPPFGCFLREAPWSGHNTWISQGWGELNICLTAEGRGKKNKNWAKGAPSYSAKNLNSYMLTRMREDREVQVSGHC